MALLSLWKTYLDPPIATILGYTYIEMLLYNFVPAGIIAFKTWHLGGWVIEQYDSVREKRINKRAIKVLRFWKK